MLEGTTPGENSPIVFASDLGFGFQLYAINDHGTGFHQLTNGDRDANLPDWSPDGRRIAFQSYDPTNDASRIAIINADGSHKHALTSKRFETSPGGSDWGSQPLTEIAEGTIEAARWIGTSDRMRINGLREGRAPRGVST